MLQQKLLWKPLLSGQSDIWVPVQQYNHEWRLRRVVPAAAVTTHTKPHAQQQLARVERAAMGQRCRPQSSGPALLCAAARFGFAVLKNNLCLLESLDLTPAASATTKTTMKTFTFRTE